VHLAGAAGAVETMLDGLDPGMLMFFLEGVGVFLVQRLVLLGGGGGLAARDTDLTLSSIIADGSAGAGIAVRGGSLTVEHVITLDNAGSGLSIIEAEAEIAWLISIGNRAGTQGGGLYLESSEVTLSQSAVVGNMSMTRGGGVANILGELEMTGTVIWANDAQVGGGLHAEPPADPDVTISWSNIQGNTPDDLDPDPGWPDAFEGGISAAPAFLGVDVTGDPQQWDLHISTSSANVDAGPPGTDDPDGSPADIGPFGGAEADGWDLDGDGWPLWWRPGPYVPGDADCDDLDPDVHPGSGC
jgi:hypothetical protein